MQAPHSPSTSGCICSGRSVGMPRWSWPASSNYGRACDDRLRSGFPMEIDHSVALGSMSGVARLAHEQRPLDLRHRSSRRVWRLLHDVAVVQRVCDARSPLRPLPVGACCLHSSFWRASPEVCLVGTVPTAAPGLRLFVVGPLIAVAAMLALIPVVPDYALWPLGIGIGFFLIFGFAAWLAVPSRVSNIRHEHIGTATGLMLTWLQSAASSFPSSSGTLSRTPASTRAGSSLRSCPLPLHS